MGADPEILAEVPFFSLLDDQERAALAARVDTVSKPAGTALFNYGDPGDSLYIVRAGEVEIFFKNDTGERIVLETAGKGDFFGEISLLDGGARTASAHVTKDLEAVVVDRGDLEEFLRVEQREERHFSQDFRICAHGGFPTISQDVREKLVSEW